MYGTTACCDNEDKIICRSNPGRVFLGEEGATTSSTRRRKKKKEEEKAATADDGATTEEDGREEGRRRRRMTHHHHQPPYSSPPPPPCPRPDHHHKFSKLKVRPSGCRRKCHFWNRLVELIKNIYLVSLKPSQPI